MPSSSIPLLDLKAQHATIRAEVLTELTRVIDAQSFILGPEVERLEHAVRTYSTSACAVGCASGSDALRLALMALDIGPGDEVLTVPYSFFATAGSIVHTGARPVFVDIEPATFNMNPALLEEVLRSHPKVKAIIPVHLFGAAADMDPILEIAARHGIPVVEDAAQAIGAEYKGRRCGSIGRIGCFSFYPSKNLGGYGDGGMLTTDDVELERRLRALRVHGGLTKYVHEWVGLNSRLDALQAVVLCVKLRHLDAWTARRQANAARYRELLGASAAPVTLPAAAPSSTRHIYNQFVIRSEHRDELQAFLRQRGIGSDIYYPIPLHLQRCFADLGYREGDFPESERAARESLALPVYPELPPDDLAWVCQSIADFHLGRPA